MSLRYLVKLKMLIKQLHTTELLDQDTPEFIARVGNTAREGVQNTHQCSDLSATPLTNCCHSQCRHDPVRPTSYSVALSVHPDQWCEFRTPLAVFYTSCNQLDSNIAKLEITDGIYILEFLSLTSILSFIR